MNAKNAIITIWILTNILLSAFAFLTTSPIFKYILAGYFSMALLIFMGAVRSAPESAGLKAEGDPKFSLTKYIIKNPEITIAVLNVILALNFSFMNYYIAIKIFVAALSILSILFAMRRIISRERHE